MLSPKECGIEGHYLLVSLSTLSGPHMHLRDVILFQLDFHQEPTPLVHPWHEPPFHAPYASDAMDSPRNQRTPGEVVTHLKSRFCPKPHQGKKAKKFRWVTTCLSSEPTEKSPPKYAGWEACASLFIAIDILTHNDDIRHSGFEGKTVETARGLLVLVACALQFLRKTETTDPNIDPFAIANLADNFSINEIQKNTMLTMFCSVLCDTVSDKDTLLNSGELILLNGGMTLFLIFSPTADDTIRTSLPNEIRLALRGHKALFYQGGYSLP